MRRHERFQVDGRARLDVHVPAGSVEVREGPAGEIEVSIDASNADEFEIDQVGAAVSVRQASRWRTRSRSVRVVAGVPSGTDVEVSSGGADIRLVGELGVARLRTASGDVEADRVARLDASTASGDVRLAASAGDVSLSTASGDCTLGLVDGRLATSSASGDVRVERVGGDVQAGSASGDVRIERCDGSEIGVKTVSGDITVGLPSGIRVEADLNTLSGRTHLPDPLPSDPAVERRQVRLRLSSVSGDLRVERLA